MGPPGSSPLRQAARALQSAQLAKWPLFQRRSGLLPPLLPTQQPAPRARALRTWLAAEQAPPCSWLSEVFWLGSGSEIQLQQRIRHAQLQGLPPTCLGASDTSCTSAVVDRCAVCASQHRHSRLLREMCSERHWSAVSCTPGRRADAAATSRHVPVCSAHSCAGVQCPQLCR